jgi:hypothetical protein
MPGKRNNRWQSSGPRPPLQQHVKIAKKKKAATNLKMVVPLNVPFPVPSGTVLGLDNSKADVESGSQPAEGASAHRQWH